MSKYIKVYNIFGGVERFEIALFLNRSSWGEFCITSTGISYQLPMLQKDSPLEDQIKICTNFLLKCKRASSVGIDSYGLKHYIERANNTYVSNGACIEAANRLRLKFWISAERKSNPNAMIGITRKSMNATIKNLEEKKNENFNRSGQIA